MISVTIEVYFGLSIIATSLRTAVWLSLGVVTMPSYYKSHHIPLFGEGQSSWEWQHAAWLGTDGSLLLAADNEVLARPGPPARRAPLLRLTNDSYPGRVYNGVSDWLYQEEVTKSSSATWGSVDGSFVMYVQYDDSNVSELKLPRISEGIGGTGASRAGFLRPMANYSSHTVFPDHVTIRYPTLVTTAKLEIDEDNLDLGSDAKVITNGSVEIKSEDIPQQCKSPDNKEIIMYAMKTTDVEKDGSMKESHLAVRSSTQ